MKRELQDAISKKPCHTSKYPFHSVGFMEIWRTAGGRIHIGFHAHIGIQNLYWNSYIHWFHIHIKKQITNY